MSDPIDAEKLARLNAIAELTLNQVKQMIQGRVSPDEILTDTARAIVSHMLGKSTLEVASIGLILVMFGLDLYGKGHMNVSEGDKL